MPARLLHVAKLMTTTLDDLPLSILALTLWVTNTAVGTMVSIPDAASISGVIQALFADVFGVSWVGTLVLACFFTGRLGMNLYLTWLNIKERRQQVLAQKIANDKAKKELEEGEE